MKAQVAGPHPSISDAVELGLDEICIFAIVSSEDAAVGLGPYSEHHASPSLGEFWF